MNIKEQITQEIEQLPRDLLQEILDFVQFKKAKYDKDNQVEYDSDTPAISTGKSLLENLQNIGHWEGDDLEECLEEVISSRGTAKFDYEFNDE